MNPKETTDPETLGLLGAIYKRLYEQKNELEYLNLSLGYYERGYYVKQDYYNGINVAFLSTLKASISEDKFEIYSNYGQAIKIWNSISDKWSSVIESIDFVERGDKEWMYFTLAEAFFGLGNIEKEEKYINLGKKHIQGDFAFDSYMEQKEKLKKTLTIINGKL